MRPLNQLAGLFHRTESALLKVMNDNLLIADSGDCSIFILLDSSVAFDTVDHDMLVECLEHCVGIKRLALNWFKSFSTFSVNIGKYCSASAIMTSGVPQGCILRLVLFPLYMLPPGQMIYGHNISFHYVDDLQLYLP